MVFYTGGYALEDVGCQQTRRGVGLALLTGLYGVRRIGGGRLDQLLSMYIAHGRRIVCFLRGHTVNRMGFRRCAGRRPARPFDDARRSRGPVDRLGRLMVSAMYGITAINTSITLPGRAERMACQNGRAAGGRIADSDAAHHVSRHDLPGYRSGFGRSQRRVIPWWWRPWFPRVCAAWSRRR